MSKAHSAISPLSKVFQTVNFGAEAHRELLKGAEILYKAVKSTMGPSGHNVIIENGYTAPLITKDGVTVAKSINLKHKLPSVGAELLKEIAAKTNELAGDGTTTATVLGYSMLAQGAKMVATGRSPIVLKRGMDYATKFVIEWLKKEAIQIRNDEDIINVGTISANGDREIGKLLCEAIKKVGQDGIITIEPAKSIETTLEVVEGMQVESGYVSPYFISDQEKLTCELQEPLILITNRKLTSLADLMPALELANQHNLPLLVIGDEVDGEVLHTLIVNKMKGVLFSCAIKAPGFGDNRIDLLNDIALVTGGTVFDSSSGTNLKNITIGDFGRCSRVVIGRNFATFVGDGDDEIKKLIEERVSQLRTVLSDNKTLDDLKRNNLRKRLAKLAGGIAVVKVGGSTEIEILEKKDRVEDALNATQAAVQEGILPGGGTAMFYASEALFEHLEANPDKLSEEELAGSRIIYESCRQPLAVIVENTGKSADVVMNTLQQHRLPTAVVFCDCSSGKSCKKCSHNMREPKRDVRFGYDALKHVYCDLIDSGILDPLKVEKFSISHANSVIGLVLSCNSIITNTDDMEEGE